MKKVFLNYSDRYLDYNYGDSHPFKFYRLYLTCRLAELYGLLDDVTIEEPEFCPEDALEKVHDRNYLHTLEQCNYGEAVPDAFLFNLGGDDNPVFKGMYDWSSLACGASLAGAKRLLDGSADIYFNIAGGMHHAMPEKAYGFCYLNDAAVAIRHLMDQGKKVLYVDTDAHHGDGVQKIFYNTHRVMTISFHESGRFIFPGTGFEYETGEGDGDGFSVNFPLYPYTDDDNYLRGFFEIVPPLVSTFQPDVMVTQLGADCLHNDELATLNVTTITLEKIYDYYRSLDIPWLALGGGGYNPFNATRAWTLALSAMTGKKIADPIPEGFLEYAAQYHVQVGRLRDEKTVVEEKFLPNIQREINRVTERLKKYVFASHFLY